jgi:autotransporter-associated beta strand protein
MTIGTVDFSNGIVGSSGGITLVPDGVVDARFAFSGTAANTYVATTTVAGNGAGGTSTLRLSKPDGTNAVPGELSIGFGGRVRLADSNQISDASTVTVSSGGTLDLDGFVEQIRTLQGGGNVMLDDIAAAGELHVANGNFSGVISDGGLGGRLFKIGPATLNLSGPSTYTGITSVDGGTLIAANVAGSATGASQVIVKSGATLAGGNPTASVGFVDGPVSIADGGGIAPGLSFGTAGKLTLGNMLTLADNSMLHMQLSTANHFASPDNDLIDIAGALTLDGLLNIDATSGFGGFGEYLLIAYAGTLIENGLKLGVLPTGFSTEQFQIDISQPGRVILRVIVPEPDAAVLALAGLWLAFSQRVARRQPDIASKC